MECGIQTKESNHCSHYLHALNVKLNDNNCTCYEDYLREEAFDESLDPKMRVLAAIQYARIANAMEMVPRLDGVLYSAWLDVVPRYLEETEGTFISDVLRRQKPKR